MIEPRWMAALALLAATLGSGASAMAADVPDVVEAFPARGGPRYFPRGDGDGASYERLPGPRRPIPCTPWHAPVPTDAFDDPSYVGSEYGLGKPSYYGFRPGLGRDDPFDRPLRRCP